MRHTLKALALAIYHRAAYTMRLARIRSCPMLTLAGGHRYLTTTRLDTGAGRNPLNPSVIHTIRCTHCPL